MVYGEHKLYKPNIVQVGYRTQNNTFTNSCEVIFPPLCLLCTLAVDN